VPTTCRSPSVDDSLRFHCVLFSAPASIGRIAPTRVGCSGALIPGKISQDISDEEHANAGGFASAKSPTHRSSLVVAENVKKERASFDEALSTLCKVSPGRGSVMYGPLRDFFQLLGYARKQIHIDLVGKRGRADITVLAPGVMIKARWSG
jgi:hypothetical protein